MEVQPSFLALVDPELLASKLMILWLEKPVHVVDGDCCDFIRPNALPSRRLAWLSKTTSTRKDIKNRPNLVFLFVYLFICKKPFQPGVRISPSLKLRINCT